MLTHVQRVLVGKATGAASPDQAVGQPLNLAAIQVGDLYLVSEDGLVLDVTAAGLATTTRAKVVRGTGNAKVLSGSLMTKATPTTRYTFEKYKAAVAQVSTFTNIVATLKANTQYQLQVVIPQDLPLLANRQDRITVSLFTGATDANPADLARLAANFNKQRDTLSIITATVVNGTDLVLTGKAIPTAGIADYEFVRFDTNFVTITAVNTVTGIPYNPTFQTAIQPTTTVQASGGKGVAVQVRQLERVALGYAGFTDPRNTWYRPGPVFGAVDGVGYDIYNVQQLISGEGMLQDSKTYPVSTLVAIVSSDTAGSQRVAFGAILDAFLGISPE